MSAVSVGRARRVVERGELTVSEISIPAGAGRLRPHGHERAQIHLVLDGEYSESARGREHRLGPGSVLYRPAAEVHENAFADGEVHGVLVELGRGGASELLPGLSPAEPLYFADAAASPTAAALDREIRRDDRESATAVAGLVLGLLAAVSRRGRERGAPGWLAEAEALLRRRFPEDLRLSRLAAAIGVPPVRLAAAFRRRFGCSVGEYLHRVRHARARRLLAGSDATIGEVALACGFYDQAHLTRVFRRIEGTTPARFRRLRRS